MAQIFGIRHHGPGSARSLLRALEQYAPDLVLIEGPPDADDLLPLLADPQVLPPIALLVYAADTPQRAVFYPFARFSPELQAIRFAMLHGIAVRFCDLPQRHWMALDAQNQPEPPQTRGELDTSLREDDAAPGLHPFHDPLGTLAAAAGYDDGERWWERMVEQRRDDREVFAAILEAMSALRDSAPPLPDPIEPLREAWMRRTIRAAEKEGFARVAVVCGAWHAPALLDTSDARADEALLKKLPKLKTAVSLAPWSHKHLASRSGYGAGVTSPGWYDHLWLMSERNATPAETAVRWLTHVARLLRHEDLDASSAHVIEAARLAEALAALRGLALPGLDELDEACRAVFAFGGDAPLHLIREQLTIGNNIGSVPESAPATPLQQDVRAMQRRLRLKVSAEAADKPLDLRKPNDRDTSALLRRLNLIGVHWGEFSSGNKLGTFREIWTLQWQPSHEIALIHASAWGTTVAAAATAHTLQAAEAAETLPALVSVVNQALLADLPAVIAPLMRRLQALSAQSDDVGELIDALVQADPQTRSSLARVLRYGNVRDTDTSMVAHVVDGLLTRICVGLPYACASLDDDAAEVMFKRLLALNDEIATLDRPGSRSEWLAAMGKVAGLQGAHGLILGRATRILLDADAIDAAEASRRLSFALSTGGAVDKAAAWIEGMVRGSGLLLIHDQSLWAIIDEWVSTLSPEQFQAVLPLVRRAFADFSAPERRQLGERAARNGAAPRNATQRDFDHERATAALELTLRILGGEGTTFAASPQT